MKNIKRPLFILNMILVFFLSCCSSDSISDQIEDNLNFHAERISLVGAADYSPKDILLFPGSDQCFLCSQSGEDYSFYRMSIEAEARPEKVLDFHGGTVFSWSVSCASTDDEIWSVYVYLDNETHMFEYDPEGRLQKDILLKDSDAYRLYAFAHWRLPDGSYVAAGRGKLLCFTDEGESAWQIDCPQGSFQGGILTANGDFYIDYIDREQKCQLAELDYQSGKLKKTFEIPGAGQVICENKESFLFTIDANSVYCINPEKGKSEPVFDFEKYKGIVSRRISSIRIGEERIELLSWDPANPWKYLDCFVLTPGTEEDVAGRSGEQTDGKTDASGRRIITLYDPHNWAQYVISPSIIDGFNEENENYVVQLDTSQPNINVRLADPDSPDLVLLLIDSNLEKYYDNGYLENLLPYFERSDVVPATEIASQFYKAYGFDEGLYSICHYSTFASLYGLESEVGSREGWTVEEFLNWIEGHPDLYTNRDVTSENLLEYCLRGNMNHYITGEGKACFEEEAFRNLLERLKNMNCNIAANSILPYDQKKESGQTFFYYMSQQDVTMLARTEALYDEKLVKKGFPNDDGKAISQLFGFGNICMMKKAPCKDGAFEFLEYLLISPWYEIQNSSSEPGTRDYYDAQGRLHTVKKILDLDMERALGDHTVNYYEGNNRFRSTHYSVTKEQEDRVIKAWDDALTDTYENQVIREIVEEEAQAYFAGQKDLDETCKVIQNRVQLFLNERR